MPRIKYVTMNFRDSSVALIRQANEIIAEYQAQGYNLTLRQLYYQFVARDIIENTPRSYKRLGSVVNDGRLGGLIDWDAITDRTRNLAAVPHWRTPGAIMASAAASFRTDKWQGQAVRPEVWIEKEALAGVFEGVCTALDVPYFSCRGYTSQSEMWAAGQRLNGYRAAGQEPVILHFGDHDPSGIDMSRDISDRLNLFTAGVCVIDVRRLALNMAQVEEYGPPPNPAKMTDSRVGDYIERFGDQSWELDALDPATLTALVRSEVEGLREDAAWRAAVEREDAHRSLLRQASERWDDLAEFLREE